MKRKLGDSILDGDPNTATNVLLRQPRECGRSAKRPKLEADAGSIGIAAVDGEGGPPSESELESTSGDYSESASSEAESRSDNDTGYRRRYDDDTRSYDRYSRSGDDTRSNDQYSHSDDDTESRGRRSRSGSATEFHDRYYRRGELKEDPEAPAAPERPFFARGATRIGGWMFRNVSVIRDLERSAAETARQATSRHPLIVDGKMHLVFFSDGSALLDHGIKYSHWSCDRPGGYGIAYRDFETGCMVAKG